MTLATYKTTQIGNHADSTYQEILIKDYMPFVDSLALSYSRKLPPSVHLDDLKSAGYLGLLDAIKKFDHKRDLHFRTYAKHRIIGSIIDELRGNNILSRGEQKRRNEENHLPTMKYFEDCGYEKVEEAFYSKFLDPFKITYINELRSRFLEVLSELPSTDCKVLFSYYLEEKSLAQIAGELIMTEGRVSQIHKKAFKEFLRLMKQAK